MFNFMQRYEKNPDLIDLYSNDSGKKEEAGDGGCWGDYWLYLFPSTGSGKEQPLGDCEGQTGLISLRRAPQISAL